MKKLTRKHIKHVAPFLLKKFEETNGRMNISRAGLKAFKKNWLDGCKKA
jgi:hypothetical protein